MKVNGDDLGIVFFEEFLDACLKAIVIESFREIALNRSFAIVQNAESIAEACEHCLVSCHEPCLEQVLTNRIGSAELKGLQNPLVLVCNRFFLHEHGAEFAGVGQSCNAVLVDIFVVRAEPFEHLVDGSGVDGFVEFVRLHRSWRGVFLSKTGDYASGKMEERKVRDLSA